MGSPGSVVPSCRRSRLRSRSRPLEITVKPRCSTYGTSVGSAWPGAVASVISPGHRRKRSRRRRRRRSEEHTSELQSRGHLVCRLLLEKKKKLERTVSTSREDG